MTFPSNSMNLKTMRVLLKMDEDFIPAQESKAMWEDLPALIFELEDKPVKVPAPMLRSMMLHLVDYTSREWERGDETLFI